MHNELQTEWLCARLVRKIIKSFYLNYPLSNLSATPSEWTSFTQLIQELMGGSVRRYLFSQWELDLLLDMQTAGLRKSARAEVLRRYLRAVQQSQLNGAPEPLRFSLFLAEKTPRRAAAGGASE
jgi:hypothetical protein